MILISFLGVITIYVAGLAHCWARFAPVDKRDWMASATLGANISQVEVTNVSKHGFWLLLDDEEPWFKDASIGKLLNVERPRPHHLYWPDLDVDLAVESIRCPEQFPLIAKSP